MLSRPQEIKSISLEKLHPDPRNANECSVETLGKIESNIAETGLCPAVQVRPHPTLPDEFILIDGHHRLEVLKKLDWEEILCQIWDISESEAIRFLLTLNRLRGTDHPAKRAELMEALLPTFDIEALSTFLPESPDEIKGLLALRAQNQEELQKVFLAKMEAERKSLPIPLGFRIPADEFPFVQKVLKQFQEKVQGDQSAALIAIFKAVSLQCDEDALKEETHDG